jgi:hypothetical protein
MMKTDISPSPVLSLHHTPFGAPLGVVWCTIGTVAIAIAILCASTTGWHHQLQRRARGKAGSFGRAAKLLDRSGHFLARFNAATSDNDISTGLGKTQCHSSAQPSAAARDQHDLSRHVDNVLL